MQVMGLLIIAVWMTGGVMVAKAADGSAVSQASTLSAEGASVLVAGSVETLASTPVLSVTAVNAVAEGAIVVLRGASEAATVSVRVTPEIAGHLSQAVGATVKVVSESAGYALIYGGEMIAFVPNALGRRLLHHAPHPTQ